MSEVLESSGAVPAVAEGSSAAGPITPGGLSLEPVNPRRWSLTVPGDPVAKGRPRIGIVHGHAMNFTPAKTRTYESEIRALAYQAWHPRQPLDDIPLTLLVDVFKSIPSSWSTKRKLAASLGDLRPTVKPDADNYAKSALDALNTVVLRDDALVVALTVRKWYSDRPRMEIALAW